MQVVGLVATGGSGKLHNLRAEPRATIVARAGWRWATVEGVVNLKCDPCLVGGFFNDKITEDLHVLPFRRPRLHTASYSDDMTTLGKTPDINQPGLASRLRLAVVRLNRRLRAQRDAEAVATLTQLSAMASLHRHGPMSPRELAERERVQPPSMTRVIAALAEGGFIERNPHPTDGRQTVVALTETGRQYVDAEVSARERWLDARLAELSADERAVLCRAAEIIDRMASL